MLLKNKNTIIYGGGGAIGGAVARAFAGEGANVFLAGRSLAKLEAVAEEIKATGGCAEINRVDALDEDATLAHADDVVRRAGTIDIVLNAIGIVHVQDKECTDMTVEQFELPVSVYTKSTFITSKAAARHMKRQRSGVILTLTTPASRMPGPGFIGHSVACAGVEALARNLAGELAPYNIRVVCLRSHALPETMSLNSHGKEIFETNAKRAGISLDEMLAGAAGGTLLKRLPTLDEVAETAVFVSSDKAGAMTGNVINLSCGFLVD